MWISSLASVAIPLAAKTVPKAAKMATDATLSAILPAAPAPSAYSIPEIDFSKDIIVIWVPGTNNHEIHSEFRHYSEAYWQDSASLALIDYVSSWNFTESVPSGEKNLRETLNYVQKHRKPGQRVVLAGESQGAMIISNVLSETKYYQMVDRVALLGHPGISKTHHHNDNDKILEINNPLDAATFEWEGNSEELLESVSKIVNFDLGGLPALLKAVAHNPVYSLWLALIQLNRIPAVSKAVPHTHDYSNSMKVAVLWLNL